MRELPERWPLIQLIEAISGRLRLSYLSHEWIQVSRLVFLFTFAECSNKAQCSAYILLLVVYALS